MVAGITGRAPQESHFSVISTGTRPQLSGKGSRKGMRDGRGDYGSWTPLSTNDGLFLLIRLQKALVIILKRGAVEAQLALAPEGSRMVVLDPPLCHKKK
jgi:hypothetical protein